VRQDHDPAKSLHKKPMIPIWTGSTRTFTPAP
jgi:hypothetical protein